MSLTPRAKEFLTAALTDVGVSNEISSAIDNSVSTASKGQPNGIASLDGSGKVPASQLTISAMEFKGTWNATTNTPHLANGTGNSGDYYLVSVAGTQNLGSGNITFAVGDAVIYDGAAYDRTPAGAYVTALTGDVSASGPGSAAATVNSVGTSSAANIHTAELAANYLAANIPASQRRYVSKDGNDSNDGTGLRPFLTVGAAQTSITDAAVTKKYYIFIGPGSFVESSGFVISDFVYLVGSGMDATTVTRSGGSAIVYTPANTAGGGMNSGAYNLTFGNLTVTRSNAGVVTTNPSSLANINLYGCRVGTFTYNGIGLQSQTGLDGVSIWNCIMGTTALHSTAGTIGFSQIGATTVDNAVLSGITTTGSTIAVTASTWNATTNTPTLANGTGTLGTVYKVSVAGTQNFGAGNITFNVNDYVAYNGTVWQQAIPTQTGLGYIAGGGRVTVYTAQNGSTISLLAYTSYDSVNGVLYGVTYQFHGAMLDGYYITNEAGGFAILNSTQRQNVSVVATAGHNNGSSINIIGGPASPLTLNGVGATGILLNGNYTNLTLLNSATDTTTTISRTSKVDGFSYTPAVPGNWSSVPAQPASALDLLAADKQKSGSAITFSTGLGAIIQVQGPSDQDMIIAGGAGRDLILQSSDGSSAFRVKNGGAGISLSAGSNFHLPNGCPLEWNTDVGLSRTGAGALAVGNGTNGDATGSIRASNLVDTAAAQTTLTGSAGTAVCSQPSQGSSYKKVAVFLNGFTDTDTQIYTFPTAFTNTPYVYGLTAGVAGATVTTTTIKFTVTTQTGFVFVEGY